jgi:hypothetical protein
MSKLENLRLDLEDRATVPFIAMFKALLARSQELDGQPTVPVVHLSAERQTRRLREVQEFTERHFKIMAKSAVRFCNGAGPQSGQLKQFVQTWYVRASRNGCTPTDSRG